MDFNASIVVYTRDVYGVSGNRTHSYTGTDCIIGSPLCCIVINYLDQIEQQERDQGAYRRSPIVVLFWFEDSLQIWARWRQNWNWLFAKLITTYYWLRKCDIPENININSVINILYWFQIWSLFVAGWENLNFQYIYVFQICLYKFYLSAVKIHIRPHRKALSMPTVCMCSRSLYCCFYYIRIKTEKKFMHCQYSQTMHEFIFGFNLDLK